VNNPIRSEPGVSFWLVSIMVFAISNSPEIN
jgi:hypothetical protein